MAQDKTPSKKGSAPSRDDRLKAALKSNMARRKAQAKARAEKNDTNGDHDDADTATGARG